MLVRLSHISAWLQVPSLDADYGLDAAQFLSQATGGGKHMTASVERRERRQQARGKDPLGSQPLLHVVLSKDGASAAESVNADMLKAGLARVKAGKTKQVAASMLCMHCTLLLLPVAMLVTYGALCMAVQFCNVKARHLSDFEYKHCPRCHCVGVGVALAQQVAWQT